MKIRQKHSCGKFIEVELDEDLDKKEAVGFCPNCKSRIVIKFNLIPLEDKIV